MRAAGLFHRGHDPRWSCRYSRSATSRSFWCSGPAIRTERQHLQGDSLNSLVPGINGPTSLAAIRNADDDLTRIRAALIELDLLDTTDIITVADHGFSTISKESHTSSTVKTKIADTPEGQLPFGFLALDLANALKLAAARPGQRLQDDRARRTSA